MELSGLQNKAFELMTSPKPGATYICGYAGTGKTTVMAMAASELGERCVVLAPTNKAAINLRKKGIYKAQTIHSCLYIPAPIEIYKRDNDNNVEYHKNPDGTFTVDDKSGEKIPIVIGESIGFFAKDSEGGLPPIALVDEASMIGREIHDDLLKYFPYVIFVGDKFQLPPVKSQDVFSSVEPDLYLTEVHRIALENPIMKYATDIRNGKEPDLNNILCDKISLFKFRDEGLFETIVNDHYQSICYKNKTRHWINDKIREMKGYPLNTLQDGEPVISNMNFYRTDIEGNRNLVCYNGMLLTSTGNWQENYDNFMATFIKFNELKNDIPCWPFWNKGYFELKDNFVAWKEEYDRRKAKSPKPVYSVDMDYAYCLTAHKAQGSEFDHVAVFDQRPTLTHISEKEKQRWWYTAVTRTKDKLLVVHKR